MTPYDYLACYYDELTKNVGYARRARFIAGVLRRRGIRGLVLDAGCGTGNLTWLLAKMGFDMIGVDISETMLSIAQRKSESFHRCKTLFLQQDVRALDLYGTVRCILCMQDTLNHLGDGLEQTLQRFSLFLEKGGIFIFDVNTQYKHEVVLSESFCFPIVGGLVVWKSRYESEQGRVRIMLKIADESGVQTVEFYEHDISTAQLQQLLKQYGYEILDVRDGETYKPMTPTTQRVLYVTRKVE